MTYTYEFEESLPKLPVPSLAATAKQVLSSLKPLLSAEEYSELLQESSEFINNKHINLIQSHLVAASKDPSNTCYLNFIADETNPGIYGELRGHLLPRNPYLVLEDDPYSKTLNPPNQSQRAANLINSSLKFIVSLRNETLKPDRTPKNNNPLTMNCYKNLFGTTRVPTLDSNDKNSITIKKCKDYNDSRHIIVITNNQYYKLEVLTPYDGESGSKHQIWFNDNELSIILENLYETSSQVGRIESINNSVGSITTQSIKDWRLARLELSKSSAETLETIDNGLFVVILDPNSPTSDQEKTSIISHGSSTLFPQTTIQSGSCTSRWYDKLQLLVTKNSCAGVVWESTSMDSTAILRFVSDIYADSILKLAKNINGSEYTLFDQNIKFVSSRDSEKKPEPVELKFRKSHELQNIIHLSETRLADIINQHEFKVLNLKLDTHFVKNFGMAVDSMLQVCFQIANYSLYGKMVNTLEPITTRKFRDSRTELVAVQNDEIFKLAKLFITNSKDQDKWDSFNKCCKAHTAQYIDAMNGKGFERHFSALVEVLRSSKSVDYLNKLNPDLEPIPYSSGTVPLLSNPVIERLLNPELLISNCGNQAIKLFGIAPAADEGLGIGYIVHADKVMITVSSKFRQTERFLDTFKRVVDDLRKILKSKSNFYIEMNDSKSRKEELKRLRIEQELKHVENIPSQRHPIDLVVNKHKVYPTEKDGDIIRTSVSLDRTRSDSTDSGRDSYDLLGGYGYFDFGELDLRSNAISRNQSFLNSSSNLHSRVASRSQSSVNLQDLNQKMSLSERIREKLSPDRFVDDEPNKDKTHVGRAIDTSQFQ